MPELQKDWMKMTSQERFFKFVALRAPYLVHLWDEKNRCLDLPAVERFLGTSSSGEVQMALFFIAVWFGHNGHDGYGLPAFDLMEAARVLDADGMRTIKIWVSAPFFP